MENEPKFEGEKMKMPSQKLVDSLLNSSQPKGIFIIILFVALAMILVGIFFWYKTLTAVPEVTPTATRPTTETNKEPETTTAAAQVESFSALSTSDEINAIEADIESTNLDSLETELQQIEAGIDSSL